jgi:hypothetical protein
MVKEDAALKRRAALNVSDAARAITIASPLACGFITVILHLQFFRFCFTRRANGGFCFMGYAAHPPGRMLFSFMKAESDSRVYRGDRPTRTYSGPYPSRRHRARVMIDFPKK